MKNSQRRLLVGSLFLLAFASVAFCFEYRELHLYRMGDELVDFSIGMRPASAPAPLISLGERAGPQDGAMAVYFPSLQRFSVTVEGIYPRPGMSFSAAVIGGLLLPCILILAACFLALGRVRPPTRVPE